MESYSQKVVVITGACGGIGQEISKQFAMARARLVLSDIQQKRLKYLSEELSGTAESVYSSNIDVTQEKQVRDFCDAAAGRFGGIDCLINTVGVVDNMGDVEELSSSIWNQTLAANLTSAFLMAKYSVPHMRTRKGGAIINLASVSGMANQTGAMAYSVTKAGLISLTKSEAIDLARYHIRANAICPGSVETALLQQAIDLTAKKLGSTSEQQRSTWESQYPTHRFSTPSDIAELALFLCSGRASNITGASFVIDGGLTALLPER